MTNSHALSRSKPGPKPQDTCARLWKYISPEPNSGCWLWTGTGQKNGYGSTYFEGRVQRAHRVMYIMVKGAIPEGKVLDHRCRVRCCVNPDHLEVVTSWENIRRGVGIFAVNAAKTHCKRGHLLAGDNLNPTAAARGHRFCRACDALAHREKRARKRALGLNRTHKLTAAQAKAILESTEDAAVVAARFGVGRGNVYAIRNRKIWKRLSANAFSDTQDALEQRIEDIEDEMARGDFYRAAE